MAKTNITKREAEKLRSAVDTYIAAQKNNTFNYKQVSHAIGANDPLQQRTVALYLSELAFDDKILEVAPGKYKTQPRSVMAEGTFSRRSNGKNSVILDDGEEIFVAERNSMHALNGDRVSVAIAAKRRDDGA